MIYLVSHNPNPIKSDLPPPVLIEVFSQYDPDVFSWEDALRSGLPIIGIGRSCDEVF